MPRRWKSVKPPITEASATRKGAQTARSAASGGQELPAAGAGQPSPVPAGPGPVGVPGVRAVLQDDRRPPARRPAGTWDRRHGAGMPGPRRGARPGARSRSTAGRSAAVSRSPGCGAGSRPDGRDGGRLTVERFPPPVPAQARKAGTGPVPNGARRRGQGPHGAPPSAAAGPASICIRQAWTCVIEAFSFSAKSRPDRWIYRCGPPAPVRPRPDLPQP